MSKPTNSRAGLIFLLFFGGAFILAWIATGIIHVPEALQRGDTEQLVVSLVVATLFPTVGFGLIWLGRCSQERAKGERPTDERCGSGVAPSEVGVDQFVEAIATEARRVAGVDNADGQLAHSLHGSDVGGDVAFRKLVE